ncbi:hypothetical protein D5086_029425 [Populus alba]|uniref:Uncharacterized protein n=1 Tax=Populus alba TaxID=43335 RepID=A0ACC4ATQ5_POPAL
MLSGDRRALMVHLFSSAQDPYFACGVALGDDTLLSADNKCTTAASCPNWKLQILETMEGTRIPERYSELLIKRSK